MRSGDVVGLGGLAVAAFSVWWTTRSADTQRREGERTERIRDAARVLARVQALLMDVDPERWSSNAGPDAQQIVNEWYRRWNGELHESVLLIYIGYPTPDERIRALALDVATHNAIVSSAMFGVQLPAIQAPWTFERAMKDWRDAQAIADDLAAWVRGDQTLTRWESLKRRRRRAKESQSSLRDELRSATSSHDPPSTPFVTNL